MRILLERLYLFKMKTLKNSFSFMDSYKSLIVKKIAQIKFPGLKAILFKNKTDI